MRRQNHDLTGSSAIAIFFLGGGVGAVCMASLAILKPSGAVSEASKMVYADIAVLVLTCVTIIITCAALGIGVLGIWGFQRIKEDAVETAVKRALSRVEDEMKDGGVLNTLLLAKFSEYANRLSGESPNTPEWGDENSEYGDKT